MSSDLDLIKQFAVQIADVMNPNMSMKAGCGGKSNALCRQRAVLILLGFVPENYWTTRWQDVEEAQRKTGKDGPGKKGIKRLQGALGVPVDGNWGPQTDTALVRVVEQELQQTIIKGGTLKPGDGGSGSGGKGGGTQDKKKTGVPPAEDTETWHIAGIPWWAALGLLLTTAGVSFYLYKRGKKAGLSGCGCAGGSLAELPGGNEEDAIPPDLAEAIESVKAIPTFLPERPPRKQKGAAHHHEE